VPALFHSLEAAFAIPEDPTPALLDAIASLTRWHRAAATALLGFPSRSAVAQPTEIAEATGQHYGRLFSAFSDRSYWDEPLRLLRTRLQRNGIELSNIGSARVLDAGCGGGRYTVAWRLLGAEEVVGIDISETGLADARGRLEASDITGVRFDHGSVLRLPYSDGAFDIVFSNGVLHHTTDWLGGVRELTRVLRPGGLGWLYLIERPGGLFWDTIEVLRVVMEAETPARARDALSVLMLPANRIFYMLDHVMVPINLRLTTEQVEAALASAGATDVRRLTRGADFDRVEAIHRGDPFARLKYGVGEHRYIFRV
jgi:SAM-dependent methyltransferase